MVPISHLQFFRLEKLWLIELNCAKSVSYSFVHKSLYSPLPFLYPLLHHLITIASPALLRWRPAASLEGGNSVWRREQEKVGHRAGAIETARPGNTEQYGYGCIWQALPVCLFCRCRQNAESRVWIAGMLVHRCARKCKRTKWGRAQNLPDGN